MLLIQLWNEWIKMFARKRTYIGFGAFLAVELAVLFLLQRPKAKKAFMEILTRNGYSFEEYYSGLSLALAIILFTILLLGALYLALVSGDIVAKEVEDGTMRMLLCRPVSRLRLLAIKWLTCIGYTFVLIFFIGATSLLVSTIYRGGLGKLFLFAPHEQIFAVFDTREGFWRFVRGICFLGLTIQVVSTMGLMFSCFRMKPAAATILTLSLMFVDFVLRGMPYFHSIQKYFITYHTSSWVRTFHEVVPWWGILESLIYLAALNLTFFIVGAVAFCSRDFKS